MRFALLLLAAAGCATSQPERFVIHGSESMDCLRYEQEECGMSLRSCGDARSIDFECLSDVHYEGPTRHVKAPEPPKPAEPLPGPVKAAPAKKPAPPPDYMPNQAGAHYDRPDKDLSTEGGGE